MNRERGFSLVELLVVITIIGILAAIALPNYTKVRIKARETEVKANLHVIQIAIDRFYGDENEYPAYLIGGDQGSWEVVHANYEGDPVWDNLYDPLIEFNYIDTYPQNPFVDPSSGGIYLEMSGGDRNTPASGDPRFGVKGTIMPNSVDDPLIFNTDPGDYAATIILTGTPLIVNYGGYGGRRGASGEPERYLIQGSFFYRAEGNIDMITSDVTSGTPTRRSFLYQSYERYILGGFGHEGTKGFDVIRQEGAGNYRHQPDTLTTFPWDIPLLKPEVFGGGNGGEDENLPFFPYEPSEDGIKFYFGAPDGFEDGVVLVYTSDGESLSF